MKQLILKWTFGTVGIISIILIFVFAFSKIGSCTGGKYNSKIENADKAVFRAYVVDSVQTSNSERNKVYRDSVIAEEQKKSAIFKQDAQKHKDRADKTQKKYSLQKQKTDSLIAAYRNDTTGHSNKCDDAIESLQNDNDSLVSENTDLRDANADLEADNKSISKQFDQCRQQNKDDAETIKTKTDLNTAQNTEINAYKKGLKSKESFFARAGKWIYGLAGAAITFIILR